MYIIFYSELSNDITTDSKYKTSLDFKFQQLFTLRC